jgi:hypothetical protein
MTLFLTWTLVFGHIQTLYHYLLAIIGDWLPCCLVFMLGSPTECCMLPCVDEERGVVALDPDHLNTIYGLDMLS